MEKIFEAAKKSLAELTSLEALEKLEVLVLGRKAGELTMVLRQLKDMSDEQKRKVGPLANQIKRDLRKMFADKRAELSGLTAAEDRADLTLSGRRPPLGHLHLTTQAIFEIEDIFKRIGFTRVRYPEVEWDWYAFEALNMPPDHPARDEWETFFITPPDQPAKRKMILTPHTSSGQVREFEKHQLPVRKISIGKCYRRQSDISHTPMFHQFEGLYLDERVSVTHLKGVLDYFVRNFFGEGRMTRIRPFNFTFTEPSFEVDINCGVCLGKACRFCKEGWLELGGSGMIHPNVLKASKLDPKKVSGFAFGWGVERVMLMKSGINVDDLRLVYKNDLRFLQQF